MTDQQIAAQLAALAQTLDLDALDEVCHTIDAHGNGVQFLPALFAILESHPDADFGSPGSIAHTAERFLNRGYKAQLFASIHRRPTCTTLGMLQRLINGLSGYDQMECQHLMEALARQSDIDQHIRRVAMLFLSH